MGVRQAWNDAERGVLHVSTYAFAPDRRGQETSFRVTNLPTAGDVSMSIDGRAAADLSLLLALDHLLQGGTTWFVRAYAMS